MHLCTAVAVNVALLVLCSADFMELCSDPVLASACAAPGLLPSSICLSMCVVQLEVLLCPLCRLRCLYGSWFTPSSSIAASFFRICLVTYHWA